jgi:hypothetical protein
MRIIISDMTNQASTTRPATQTEILASDIDAATRYATSFSSYAQLKAAIVRDEYTPTILTDARMTPEMTAAKRHLINRLSSDGLPCWRGSKG